MYHLTIYLPGDVTVLWFSRNLGHSMQQLVYLSNETAPFSVTDLKRVLTRSRMRNADVGLSGMLLYKDGWFLQVLEGEDAALLATFQRIEADPRHASLRVLRHEKIEAKRFGQWSMGFPDSSEATRILRGFVDVGAGFGLSGVTAESAEKLLSAFGAWKGGNALRRVADPIQLSESFARDGRSTP